MKIFKLVILFFCFNSITFANLYLQKVYLPDFEEQLQKLRLQNADIAGTNAKSKTIELITDQPYIFIKQHLEKFLVLETIESSSYNEYSELNDTQPYYDYEKTKSALSDIQERYSYNTKIYSLNEHFGEKLTENKNEILALKIGLKPNQLKDLKKKILIIGQHHARELMTHHAVLDSAASLLKLIDKNNTILDQYSFYFVPVVNPDGLNYVFSDERFWRKNRRVNENSRYRGIDLNRNYEFKYGECGSNSSSPSSEIYKGPKAFSEPETRVMDKLNSIIKAQFVISYHSSGNEVLLPYICGNMAESWIPKIGIDLAQHLGFGYRKASSSGEDFEHHYAKHGSISYLLEIGTSFQPSYEIYNTKVRPKVEKVIPYLLDQYSTTFTKITVIDKETKKPIKAKLSIKEIKFSEGEIRETNNNGILFWHLPSGTYHLDVASKNDSLKNIRLDINKNSEKSFLIEL